jgi:RNA polymerase sigma-70 factor, ECF subfamily
MSVLITEKLLGDLKKGNEKAFTAIFNNYFSRLCQFANTYVVDEAASKNIVQDIFVQLWETKNTIRENTSIMAYLLTITKNSCLDYLKHKQVEFKYQKLVAKEQKELELNYFALKRLEIDLLDYEEIVQIIEKTLTILPPQCQQVFRMSRFENLSNTEIAGKLNVSIKAVEANITRALKIFRKELKDYISILLILNIP